MTWTNMVDKLWPSVAEAGKVILIAGGKILLAVLILVLGLYVSRWISAFVRKGTDKIKLDERTAKIGLNEICERFGLGKSPSYILGFVVSWFIVFVALYYSAKVLNMQDLQSIIEKFLLLIPNAFVSLVIVFAGLLLGKFLSNIIANSSQANKLKGGVFLAQAVNVFIIVFAVLVALENLGLSTRLVNMFVSITLASLGLAFALAVGLGARPVVEDVFRDMLHKDKDKNKK